MLSTTLYFICIKGKIVSLTFLRLKIEEISSDINGKKYFNAGIGTDNPDADAVHPDNSARFMAGIVTAREYYGTFKGTLENTVV